MKFKGATLMSECPVIVRNKVIAVLFFLRRRFQTKIIAHLIFFGGHSNSLLVLNLGDRREISSAVPLAELTSKIGRTK
jgi:hypothetical protein